jgi:hypothetical protein
MSSVEHELWFAALNPARRQAVYQLAELGQLEQRLLAAIQAERWNHAGGLLLASDWGRQHRHTAARIARQLETGQHQGADLPHDVPPLV